MYTVFSVLLSSSQCCINSTIIIIDNKHKCIFHIISYTVSTGDGGSVKCQSAYDAEINAVHNGVSQEHIAAKEELSKKQDTIKGDTDQLQQELNVSCIINTSVG